MGGLGGMAGAPARARFRGFRIGGLGVSGLGFRIGLFEGTWALGFGALGV